MTASDVLRLSRSSLAYRRRTFEEDQEEARKGKERKGQHKERSRLIIVDELVRAELTHSLDIQTEPPWQGGDQDDEGVCRLQAV